MAYLGRVPANVPITASDIPDNSITAAKILDGVITPGDLSANAVTTAKIAGDAVDGTKIADNAINSEHYTDASIDLAHMSVNSIDSDQYVDGSIDTAHIANDQIDSQHYIDGSIDTAHVADAAITAAKIHSAVELGGPSLGASSVIRTNAQTISENITIPSTSNGSSVGPISVADGYTITISGYWSII